MLYYISWIVLWPLKFFFKKAKGIENIPKNGPIIVVANHIHDLDPYTVGSFLPFGTPVHWFAKKELLEIRSMRDKYALKFNVGFLSWAIAWIAVNVVKYSLTIPVDRGDVASKTNISSMRKAIRLLKKKKSIGIFGEGGIGREGDAQPIFVNLAKTTMVPILPVKIEKKRVVFGKLIRLKKNRGKNREEDKREANKKEAEKIMELIYDL